MGPISSAGRDKARGCETGGGISYLLSRRGDEGVSAMLQSITPFNSTWKVKGLRLGTHVYTEWEYVHERETAS